MQQVNGVRERMTRRKFRDFLHDQIGISVKLLLTASSSTLTKYSQIRYISWKVLW